VPGSFLASIRVAGRVTRKNSRKFSVSAAQKLEKLLTSARRVFAMFRWRCFRTLSVDFAWDFLVPGVSVVWGSGVGKAGAPPSLRDQVQVQVPVVVATQGK
jgi:hypothetical protein